MAPTDGTQSEATARLTIADEERQFLRYGVILDSKEPLPNEFKSFLRHVVRAPRGGPGSPAAKILHAVAPATQIMNEFEAIEHLAPHLGFLSAHTKGGAKYNHMVPEVEFNQAYISHRDDPTFKLKKPRADKALGYMRREFIRAQPKRISDKLQPAFTAEEESKLLDDPAVPPISRYILCPWYTMEFKSSEAYAGLKQAKLQVARNGAAACEHMYQLYRRAGVEPTAVDTMHWSLTCNTNTVELFYIWRQQIDNEPVRYHLRREWSTLLQAPNNLDDDDKDEDEHGVENAMVADLRNRLRNLLDHASSARLTRIK
ncbi:hypothetical protein C7974DRAFT_322154, partial [Boeremia exigua]|uniref:uncharacterized protein n=1 Tax=Boeremia exigua TaxID=749465 RepID=UPI001E8E43B4